MILPNRHANTPNYRYGFNGKEKDDELKGEGNSLDFGNRMHDPRVGRFFSTDKFEAKFKGHSPYSYARNRVVEAVDKAGDSVYYTVRWIGKGKERTAHIDIIVEGSVIDLSSQYGFNIHDLSNEINSESTDITMFGQSISDFKFKDSDGNPITANAEVNLKFKFKGVNKFTDIKPSDHLIVVSDWLELGPNQKQASNGVSSFGGKIAFLDGKAGDGWYGSTVALHEVITHNLGLTHSKNPFTITDGTGNGVGMFNGNIIDDDLQEIISNIDSGKLNKGLNLTESKGMFERTLYMPNFNVRTEGGGIESIEGKGHVNTTSVSKKATSRQYKKPTAAELKAASEKILEKNK